MRPLVHPIRDPETRTAWSAAHDRCQICGRTEAELRRARVWPSGLQTHHIIKPGRSDEPCNLLRVCSRHHDLIEGYRVRGCRAITLGNVLWAKQRWDPEEYDPERLMALWGRASLPELEKLGGHS